MDLYLREVRKVFDYEFSAGESQVHTPSSFTPPLHFTIGLIVGVSGCGKTRYLESLKTHKLIDLQVWDDSKTVIENIDVDPSNSITKLLAAGFSSVPQWFLKYSDLSEGQKFRANIAKCLTRDNLAIDEFTSKLDRLTARNTAHNVHRYVHTNNLAKIIIASPFRDIIPYLRPDWVYDMSSESTFFPSTTERRWAFELRENLDSLRDIDTCLLLILQSDMKTWEKYKKYHYLSSGILNNGEYWELFTMCENTPLAIGYIVITPLPLKDFRAKREHRLVILPEVQGMGIGIALSEFMGEMYTRNGYRYYCKTSHPKLGLYRDKHPEKWRPSTYNGKSGKGNKLSNRLFRKRNGLPYQNSEDVREVVIDMKTNKPIQNKYDESMEKVYYCHEYFSENATSAAIVQKPNTPATTSHPILSPKNEPREMLLYNQGWKPTILSGVLTLMETQAIVRFRQNKTYFQYSELGRENAKSIATQFLELTNMEHLNPNLYKQVDDSTILVMINRTIIISFHPHFLPTIKCKKLFYRNDTTSKRIYYNSRDDNHKKRVYLDTQMEYEIVEEHVN